MKKLLFLFLIMLLASCRTVQLVPLPQIEKTDKKDSVVIKYVTQTRDSVHIRDSVIIHADGSKSTAHYENRLSNKETWWFVNRHINNTYEITKTIAVKVPRSLSWFQQLEIWAGRFVLLVIVVMLVFVAIRYIPKRI